MSSNEGAYDTNPAQPDDRRTARTDGRRTGGPAVEQARAKTSAAAAFALAFGVAAFVLVLTAILAPVGLVFGIVGLILGIVGIVTSRRVGVTGKGVAITGLVLSILAVLLAGALAVGVTTFINNQGAVDRLERQVEQLRDQLPRDVNVPQP